MVYWRRRLVAFVIGLSVLAALSWAAAGGVGSMLRAVRDSAARSGTPGVAASRVGPAGLPAGQRATAGTAAPAGTAPAQAAAASQLTTSLPACPSADVVLSLFSTQASYTVREQPELDVDVVSTAGSSCAFDVGAAHVVLQISAGAAVVWTSADCAEGAASQPVTLHRGVPTVVVMTWDDQYSSPGCPVPGRAAPAGSYTARATDGPVTSNAVGFQIS